MNFFIIFLLTITTLSANLEINTSKLTPYDKQTIKRLNSWEAMKKSAQNETIINKLKIVNNYFNKLKYSSDIKKWKTNDYWATPYEFLEAGSGDCEDFAIAKYFTLKELGVDENKLKLTYAKLSKDNKAHIVLSYYHKKNYIPIILDNVNKKLQISTKRKDLKELRVINKDVIYSKFKLQNNHKYN